MSTSSDHDDDLRCVNCGACCLRVGSPPFRSAAELDALPIDLRRQLADYVGSPRHRPDGPCCWLDLFTGQCRHHELRPQACRDLAVAGHQCETSRRRARLTPLTVGGLPAAEQAVVAQRLAVCRRCDAFSSATGERGGWPIWRVSCRRCGCGGLPLRDGACPAGKWPMDI